MVPTILNFIIIGIINKTLVGIIMIANMDTSTSTSAYRYPNSYPIQCDDILYFYKEDIEFFAIDTSAIDAVILMARLYKLKVYICFKLHIRYIRRSMCSMSGWVTSKLKQRKGKT